MKNTAIKRLINKQEYDRLLAFTREHYVEFYDLQLELADHLCNSIEEYWVENPNKSFEEALQFEFKKFGIFGFMNIVEAKQITMISRYNKMLWGYFRTFLKIPQITVLIALLLVFQWIITQFDIATYLFGATLIAFLYLYWQLDLKIKRKNKETQKKWLALQSIQQAWSFYLIVSTQFCIQIIGRLDIHLPIISWVLALVFSLFVVLIYIKTMFLPKKIDEYMLKQYQGQGYLSFL